MSASDILRRSAEDIEASRRRHLMLIACRDDIDVDLPRRVTRDARRCRRMQAAVTFRSADLCVIGY